MGSRYLRGVASAVAIVGLVVPASDAVARAGSGSSSSGGSGGSRGSSSSGRSGGSRGSGRTGGTRFLYVHPLPGGGYGYDPGSTVGGVDLDSVGGSLLTSSVQVVGSPTPTLTASEVRSLRRRIAKKDPGRIWIAVTPSLDQDTNGQLANSLGGLLNARGGGTVIVASGTPVWAASSFEGRSAVQPTLQAAFTGHAGTLAAGFARAVDLFARADAAAGHPKASPQSSSGSSTSNGTNPNITIPKVSTGPNWGLILGLGLGLGIPALIGLSALVAALRARRGNR